MLCIKKNLSLRYKVHEWHKKGKRIALVPTIGNIHTELSY